MPRRLLRLAAILSILAPALPARSLAAQAAPAFELHGTVVDASQAPIVAAHLTAVLQPLGPAWTALTDSRGAFTLSLPAGVYAITAAADGFINRDQTVTLASSGAAPPVFVLAIAAFSDTVTVSAPRSGYRVPAVTSAMKTATSLLDTPQSVTIVTKDLMADQLMTGIGDVVRYIPGLAAHQGENNRDQVVIRGNSSSADFFVNGVRDDVQYYRDLYNLERIEALKGANAMIFGRGGAGGVINRVTKDADFRTAREVSLQSGMFGARRFTADFDEPLSKTVAFRLNAMLENSGSFRKTVDLQRYGLAPTLTFSPDSRTRLTVRYEDLNDRRGADRGVPSFQGRPVDVDRSTFYGNPDLSDVRAQAHLTSAAIEHRAGRVTLRNQTLYGDYDRSYQNFVPGAVSADGRQVTLTAYNNATRRRNLFNQTDLTFKAATGRFKHTLLAGVEASRQLTSNFRNTGFFDNTTTSVLVPFEHPTIGTPVTFRQSAADADNHLRATDLAAYGQDQIELSRHLQVLAGLRLERFDLEYHNNRSGSDLERIDRLFSPRAGVIVKPIVPLSIYASSSMSYLPSSGDQFSSLTTVTEQVKPEQFRNNEIGAKWDVSPELTFTAAVYRLDRTHTRATDPNDPTRIVQTGSSRTDGFEAGLNGRVTPVWSVAGGYAYQEAFVTSATTTAQPGQQAAQVPHHTLSLWNNVQLYPRASIGLGLLRRSDMFAAIDNTVTLNGYTRLDLAGFVLLSKQVRLQLNVENLFDATYFANADSNTNISPGSPRVLRIGLTTRF